MGQFLIGSYIKTGPNTVDFALRVLLNDFDQLATGKVGDRVVAQIGRKVYKFVLMVAKADEEARCNIYGLPHWTSPEPCSECLANRSNRQFTDLRPDATWRATEGMAFELYRVRLTRPLHPLAASHYFCDRWFFFLDLMHLMDCKGVSSEIMGSVLSILSKRVEIGPNIATRIARINQHKEAWYAANPGTHRLPTILARSLVGADGWASLSGPAIKAAATRAAAPWIAALSTELLTRDTEHDRQVKQLTADLVAMYRVLYDHGIFIPDPAVAQLQTIIQRMGSTYQSLRQLSAAARQLHFRISPKVHKMMHLPMMARVLNPRHIQNYAEESLVGTVARIWKGSLSGRQRRAVQRTVLAKKLTGLCCRLESLPPPQ